MSPSEDQFVSALFDMASNTIEEQREKIARLEAENADLRDALKAAHPAAHFNREEASDVAV